MKIFQKIDLNRIGFYYFMATIVFSFFLAVAFTAKMTIEDWQKDEPIIVQNNTTTPTQLIFTDEVTFAFVEQHHLGAAITILKKKTAQEAVNYFLEDKEATLLLSEPATNLSQTALEIIGKDGETYFFYYQNQPDEAQFAGILKEKNLQFKPFYLKKKIG